MNAGAAIFMALSWLGVLGLTTFCFWKVLVNREGAGRKKK